MCPRKSTAVFISIKSILLKLNVIRVDWSERWRLLRERTIHKTQQSARSEGCGLRCARGKRPPVAEINASIYPYKKRHREVTRCLLFCILLKLNVIRVDWSERWRLLRERTKRKTQQSARSEGCGLRCARGKRPPVAEINASIYLYKKSHLK